jgi:hypothetical protein
MADPVVNSTVSKWVDPRQPLWFILRGTIIWTFFYALSNIGFRYFRTKNRVSLKSSEIGLDLLAYSVGGMAYAYFAWRAAKKRLDS